MNCHKLCKDQVAFECKKNAKGTNAVDSPTPSSTPVAMGSPEGGFDASLWHWSCSVMVFCLIANTPKTVLLHTLTSEVINKGRCDPDMIRATRQQARPFPGTSTCTQNNKKIFLQCKGRNGGSVMEVISLQPSRRAFSLTAVTHMLQVRDSQRLSIWLAVVAKNKTRGVFFFSSLGFTCTYLPKSDFVIGPIRNSSSHIELSHFILWFYIAPVVVFFHD